MSGCLQLLDTGDEPCGVSIKTVSENDTEILLYKDMSFKKLNCHIYTGILCLSTPLKNKYLMGLGSWLDIIVVHK